MTKENESQGHPALQAILNKLPPELQAIIKPDLENLDKNFQQKVQGLQEQFSPYKEFAENEVDPQVLKQSLFIANHLQTNPEDFIRRAVDNYGLGEIFASGTDTGSGDNGEITPEWEAGNEDDMDPQIAELVKSVQGLQEKLTAEETAKQEQQQIEEFNAYVDGLATEHGEFDRDYVLALMSTGVDGADAVKRYNDIVGKHAATVIESNQQNTSTGTEPGFVPMGANGTAGSGTADNPVDMGSLTNNQTADLVAEMIAKASQE